MRVFLGGSCNGSRWRNRMMVYLYDEGVDYFNPVVDDWTPEHQEEEIKQRAECDYCLYTITPKMKGVYSIAEAVDDSNKRPNKTIIVMLKGDDGIGFTPAQWESLKMFARMIERNGAKVFTDLKSAALFIGRGGNNLVCAYCQKPHTTAKARLKDRDGIDIILCNPCLYSIIDEE